MTSLDDLPDATRPTSDVHVCLDGALVRRIADLTEEVAVLTVAESERPRKNAQGVSPRLTELRAELDAANAEAESKSGVLTVTAVLTQGEWYDFVDANPPRAEGSTGRDRDALWGYERVNTDALAGRLEEFATAWDGDPFKPGQFKAKIEPRIYGGDIGEVVKALVTLYEGRPDFRQLRMISSAFLPQSPDSNSPATSDGPPASSTDGPPAPSSEATTETASE